MTETEQFKATHLGDIVRAAIHPAIGVARVGDSPEEFFIGPEVPDPPPVMLGESRDPAGALKRQAARFRVFGYDNLGKVVAELTANCADINWSVHLANKKAAWYQFQIGLDIPEAPSANPSRLRNEKVTDRGSLAIDPGPRGITGRDRSGQLFDTGTFLGQAVYLGELRTDAAGRLVVLGGRGVSAAMDGSPATDFANNDGWHDDVSDGPVTAGVTLDGRTLPVDPAWVVVAPPNYAPNLKSVRTLYDLLSDVFVAAGQLSVPPRVSFTLHILPILLRMADLQWVNRGFAAAFGWRGSTDLTSPDTLMALADPAPALAPRRREIAHMFRSYDRDGASPVPWPWLYGDAMAIPPTGSPRQYGTLGALQMRALSLWANGHFDADYDPKRVPPRRIEDVPPGDQPAMLDRAALEFCLADALHPGCEVAWPIRHATMYAATFRIRHRAPRDVAPSYPNPITPAVALALDGPLYEQGPGDLTRWMAVPWQTDTASCRSGYQLSYDLYVPTFWPAHVPNDVLTGADWAVVSDPKQAPEVRLSAFRRRSDWIRPLGPAHPVSHQQGQDEANAMVTKFGGMGVVEARTAPDDSMGFPALMQVETPPTLAIPPAVAIVPIYDANEMSIVNKEKRFPNGLLKP